MLKQRIANFLFKIFLTLTCRVDAGELNKIPLDGPGLLVSNHTTIIEGPLYYVMLYPRKMTALAKAELWQNPITGFFMNAWNVIPLKRGRGDREAIDRAMKALDDGYFLGITPEGTRSKTGALMRGHTGAAHFAAVKRVPVYPIAQWGLRNWPSYLLKFRRCPVQIRLGDPFYITHHGDSELSIGDRRRMTDEIMVRIAELLPENLRGYYSGISRIPGDGETFIEPIVKKM